MHAVSSPLAAQTAENALTLKDVFSRPTSGRALSRIPAMVTYVDPAWKLLFAQDQTAGCLIQQDTLGLDSRVGDQILIEGYRLNLVATNPVHQLRDVSMRKIGEDRPPEAVPVTATNLVDPAFAALWVKVQGTVRSIVTQSRVKLNLNVEGKSVAVWVRHHQASDLVGLLDAEIAVQGSCFQQRPRGEGTSVETLLMTEDFRSVRIIRPGPVEPYDLPQTPISQLATLAAQPPTSQRRLVRGRVVVQEQGVSLSLRDETGEVVVLSPLQVTLAKEDLVEAIGFPALENGAGVLKEAQFRVLKSSGADSSQAVAAQANPQLPVLASIKEVLALTRAQARKEYPLRVRGVVTYFNPAETALFIQDDDQGIYVGPVVESFSGKAGQLVEVSGVTKPGGVLTMISPARITVLGDGTMPSAATNMSHQTAITGMFDSRRVKVNGVVQSTSWADGSLSMDLVVSDGRFWCLVPAPADSALCTNLLNAAVEVEAVCILNLDPLGSPLNAELRIQQESDVHILEIAHANAPSTDAMSIADARAFIPLPLGSHRVKVRGVATFWRPGAELYLQDSTGAICAETDQTSLVQTGDEVEVMGFRAVGETGMRLKNAEYEVKGKGQPPVATPLRAGEVLNLTYRDRLLQIEGRLQQDVRPSIAPELVLQDGQDIFTARLEPLGAGQRSPAWRAQSLLRVTGICQLRLDASHEPRAFRLLVRSPADVTVLQPPPWFTTQRVVAISLLLLATVLLAFGWIAALRARVAKQTDLIRQRLESEAATERRLALVWEASADGMRLTDANGIVVKVNEAYCQMTKKSRSELEEKTFLEAFKNGNAEAVLAEYLDRFNNRVATPWQEIEMVLWNGQPIWFECADRFVEHTESTTPLLLSQFRDVTGRKLAEEERNRLREQLLQSQKTESIGRLAGGVAHDFNNMLQVILGNTMLALEEIPPGSPLHDSMLEVKRSAERSADLTRQLLAFARKQTVRPKILDLNETVGSLLSMLQRLIGENIELVWVPGLDLWPVKVDPAQIDQILVNLCVNARDAISQSGRITLQTANARQDEPWARTHSDCGAGDYVLLTVSDTGHGIDESTRKHLFEPFFTTKDVGKGTGLGLATVFGIVKQNRGVIDVESEPHQGATFKIYLPRSETPAVRPTPVDQKGSLHGNETVLLVEDEEQILTLGCRALTQYGYRVLTAQTPGAALELVQRHPERIHLLITDVIMPVMNGRELKSRVDALKPGIRFIFMSGYTADIIADHGILEEGIEYLQKPFSVETLGRKVREVLGGRT